MDAKTIIVMGVSGSGKTTIGIGVAEKLGWLFLDADDFHPASNIEKMTAGQPLTDADRWPWLDRLNALIADHLSRNEPLVLACSALKRRYRDRLTNGNLGTEVVYLDGSFDLIWGRMQARKGHYMRPQMLQSQFDALEMPTPEENIVTVRIDGTPDRAIQEIVEAVRR